MAWEAGRVTDKPRGDDRRFLETESLRPGRMPRTGGGMTVPLVTMICHGYDS